MTAARLMPKKNVHHDLFNFTAGCVEWSWHAEYGDGRHVEIHPSH